MATVDVGVAGRADQVPHLLRADPAALRGHGLQARLDLGVAVGLAPDDGEQVGGRIAAHGLVVPVGDEALARVVHLRIGGERQHAVPIHLAGAWHRQARIVSGLALGIEAGVRVADIAAIVRVVPVDGQRVTRRLGLPLVPVGRLRLAHPGQQRLHLITLPGTRLGVGDVLRLIELDDQAVHAAVHIHQHRLAALDQNEFAAFLHAFPLAVVEVARAVGGIQLLGVDVDVVAETRRRPQATCALWPNSTLG